MTLHNLLNLLSRLEKEALAALGRVENSKDLTAWHKRYIKCPPELGQGRRTPDGRVEPT